MIRTCTWEHAKPLRRSNDKATFRGFVTDFIVPGPADEPRAQAYLVEQSPDWILPVHFHLQHQYQVVTAGSGTLGRHPVGRLSIHYASPESGYGPLTAGPEGLSYLTLRVQSDEGAWYLPESRARMLVGMKKRQVHAQPQREVTAADVRAMRAVETEVLIAPEPSGLAAGLLRIPANEVVAESVSGYTGDRFYVVTAGAMVLDHTNVTALATVFVSREERLDVRSGADGLEVLVLQFPDAARSPRAAA
jgi:hypothetical protein